MSLQEDWDAAVPVGKKAGGDLNAEWDKAKPINFNGRGDKPAAKPKDKFDLAGPLGGQIGGMEAGANMLTGMFAKPASDLAGLATLMGKIPGIRRDNTGFDPETVRRDVRNAMTYEPRTKQGETAMKYNPLSLFGQLWGQLARGAGQITAPPETSGPARSAAGSGVEETVNQLPQLLGLKVGDAGGAVMKGTARDLMQSALKPDLRALKTGKADAAIETLLDKGINVSKGGAEKLKARVDALNDRIASLIDNSPAVIDKQHVGYYVQKAFDKFKNQVDKAPDIAAIQKVYDRFLADVDIPDKIPVKSAQELKQGTYKALGDKSYGELKGAEIEAQKQLARGLKDEIARAVPEVRKLNAEESKALNALSLVERRALMEANKNPVGLGWMTTNPEKFAAWMADRSGLFKSLVARMLNASAPAARAAPPLGMAVTSQATAPGQIAPPPQ